MLIFSAPDLVVACALSKFSLKCIAATKSLQKISKCLVYQTGTLPAMHSNIRKGHQLWSKVINYTAVTLQAAGLLERR